MLFFKFIFSVSIETLRLRFDYFTSNGNGFNYGGYSTKSYRYLRTRHLLTENTVSIVIPCACFENHQKIITVFERLELRRKEEEEEDWIGGTITFFFYFSILHGNYELNKLYTILTFSLHNTRQIISTINIRYTHDIGILTISIFVFIRFRRRATMFCFGA